MKKGFRSVKGMHDVMPDRSWLWQYLEAQARAVFSHYGYREIRTPIVEHTAVFTAAIGATTDVVEKEMYSFDDRNQESLSLRPEGTAGVVRAALQNGLLSGPVERLWYIGPMFRYERPQRGRTRQFHQIGAEVLAAAGPDVDLELISLLARLWKNLGLQGLRLELNTLGTAEARAAYRERLVAYFSAHLEQLDEDSRRRLNTNPLRILDSKNPDLRSLIDQAPTFDEDLDEESAAHFAALCAGLDDLGIDYQVNPRLVRGLDYYSRTVFEWITDELGAQGTVCGGGRYDGLVEIQGGKPTPAVGFSMGMERLLELMQKQGLLPEIPQPDAYLVAVGEAAQAAMPVLAEQLRDACPGLCLVSNAGGGSFKAQFKRADRSGAAIALVLGDSELAEDTVVVKDLRQAGVDQQTLSRAELAAYLNERLAEGRGHPYNGPVL